MQIGDSTQRVLAALRGEPHDRVPYMEVYVDEHFAHRLLGLPPIETPAPMSGTAPFTCAYFGGDSYDPLELAKALDLDCLCMSIQPQIYFNPRLVDGQYFVEGGFLHTRQDLHMVHLVDPEHESLYEPACRFLERVHAQGLAAGCFINLASDPVVLGMGWDYFSYALYDDWGMVETLFDLYSDWNARAVDHICSLGFDFIWAGDDIAFKSGPMISPKIFRELFLPYYRRVAERISLPWIFHTDGNFLPILEDLLSLGMNGLHPIEPEAVDIQEVKQRVGDRVTLVGNIDINLLSNGSPEEVAAITRETIHRAGADGRFILSSSNSITRSCSVENVLAMVRACREFGDYLNRA
jgi:uroporphyrinogen decarboxylase